MNIYSFLIVGVFIIHEAFTQNVSPQSEWPPGWTEKCLGCICDATTGCNQTIGCFGDFCGMFFISRPYWIDAGSPLLQGDSPNEPEAFKRCVKDSYCASRTVNQYVQKFVQDCNNDDRHSCDDYARLHYLGFAQCTRDIENESYYRSFKQCFFQNPAKTTA